MRASRLLDPTSWRDEVTLSEHDVGERIAMRSSWKIWIDSRRRSCPPSARPRSPQRRS